ncbi:acyltransferase family protein [Mucilaginibacter phyllosphaerae]|uniref:Peptidoglycan/LPS O-acetylase OafA/YrhL n=1 Tax=Mucilaginibacter phyllosphaerae TaxID=1812349 RepID=A0ABR6I6A7_9SPHI|nr:acyltransferase [Mucilaginibacter phyllosphaerae]MBB3968562.1 peptidoglycan/LPS O-acetylase OafA/YrhL [Mucilaginibacter phyllosphaerae]
MKKKAGFTTLQLLSVPNNPKSVLNKIELNSAASAKPNNRFVALDGLRALAALGVLWIHTWAIYGSPRLWIGPLDITSILALGGNGVDLFFVISGFCMYYFYAKNKVFVYKDFGAFIKNRWARLSPAFYTICAIYIVIRVTENHQYAYIKTAITSLIYFNGILPEYSPESIFWSLTAEWEFYLIIPFLLIYQNRLGFKKTFFIISITIIVIALTGIVFLRSGSDDLLGHIIFRYFEFMWGILAGKLLLAYPRMQLKNRWLYLIFFIIITYTGRLMISKPVLSLIADYYNLFKLIGFTLMGLGFGGITYLAITSTKYLKFILGNKVLSYIGKISFSFYLYHGLVHQLTGNYLIAKFPNFKGILAPITTFFISAAILIPIATLSFIVLEKPFMARSKKR